jgi:lipopolysaccharide export system permease protein
MPLLDRLLLREISIPLGVGILAVLQLLVILQLLQLNEVVFTSAVTPIDLVRVTAALAPHFLVLAVPLAFMLGLQLGLGRLAADRELLALSAAGTHPLRLYRVPVAIGAALGVLVAGLTQWAEPWGLQQLNGVLNDIIKRNLKSGLEPGIFNDGLPRFMIYVSSEDPAASGGYATWHGVLIEDTVGDGSPLLALAEVGGIEDTAGEALTLRLLRGELHRMEPAGETVARFEEGRFLVGVQGTLDRKNRFARDEAAMTREMIRRRLEELRRHGDLRETARLQVELVRRSALPLACIAFAMFGVPMAMASLGGRGFAYLITVGVFVAFYALSRFGVALAENGLNPWIAGFVPDAVVFALGTAYTARLIRNGIGKAA